MLLTINSSGQLHRNRITVDDVAIDTSLQNMLSQLSEIKKYREVTFKSSRQLRDQLCVVVRIGDFESIVVAFIGEKVVPLIG